MTVELEEAFRAAWARSGVTKVIAHASLLLNLASSQSDLRQKSIVHLAEEIRRAQRLGIASIVVHPGSNADTRNGIRHIVEGLTAVTELVSDVRILLETVAGQGHSIGHRFEELADILSSLGNRNRFGVCLDTCHVFAAGYDVRGYHGYKQVMQEFNHVIGLDQIHAFHVNDSRVELGRRVDRHSQMIGGGFIGSQTFHALLRDPQFCGLPMIAEVPDGERLTTPNVDFMKQLRMRTEPIIEEPREIASLR